METPSKLPPIIQQALNEQKRKSKKQRIIIIIVAIILFITLGYLGNKYPSITSMENKNQKIYGDTALTKQSLTQSTGTGSVIKTQIKTDSTVASLLSEDDQETKGRYGVVSLELYVKDNMNDPDSYEKVSSNYSYHGTYFIVTLKFRGKNAFGGKVVNYAKAKTDLEGNVIEVIDNDN